jgi:hypothetical protein
MNLEDLLEHFRDVVSIAEIRGTERLTRIAGNLPTDPQIYVRIARDLWNRANGRASLLYDDPLFEFTVRLEAILRELYVVDFRTLEALLTQCDFALADSDVTGFGTNQTAIIASALPPKGRAFPTDEDFLRKVESFLASDSMRHNAREIRRRLLRRSPELVPAPDRYPAT